MHDIIIIGAGMAGLACGRRLARAGHAPLLLDKSRGLGGRMATRRVTLADCAISFDHGAQYFTARDPAFAADLRALGPACAQWADGAAEAHFVGAPGMSALPRAMAAGLEIRTDQAVSAVRAVPDGWEAAVGDTYLAARRLVLAVPAPQAAALLGDAHPLHARIAAVSMAPCLTLMAAFPAATPPPFISQRSDDQPLAWIAHDNSKPGRTGGVTTWVAQTSPAWSAQHLDDTPEANAARLLPLLAEQIGVAPAQALHAAVHRWRYAQTVAPLGQAYLSSDDGSLFVGGDWCLGARVEHAWQSGTSMADAIITGLS